MTYVFDIDGTISDLKHRLHFIESQPKQWSEFFMACVDDCPITEVIYMARILFDVGHHIVLITGRSNECKAETQQWLKDFNVPYNVILMRKQGDHRPDNLVKSELLDELLTTVPQDQIQAIFEDGDQVVKMYRERGLRVFQVAEGNF